MKKRVLVGVAVVASFFLLVAAPSDAIASGRGAGQGSPGLGGQRFQGHGHHGFRSARVVVGIGSFWGPYWGPYWYPPYYYPPVYAPAYTAPVVAEPLSFIQQSPPPNYWYYCEAAKAYYPYVQQCPAGWLTVVPPAATEPQP